MGGMILAGVLSAELARPAAAQFATLARPLAPAPVVGGLNYGASSGRFGGGGYSVFPRLGGAQFGFGGLGYGSPFVGAPYGSTMVVPLSPYGPVAVSQFGGNTQVDMGFPSPNGVAWVGVQPQYWLNNTGRAVLDAPRQPAELPGVSAAPELLDAPEVEEAQQASVTLMIEPKEAILYLNGKRMGTAGQFLPEQRALRLAPGKHRLEARRAGYETLALELNLESGKQLGIGRRLRQLPEVRVKRVR